MSKQKIETCSFKGGRADEKRSILLALINRPTDAQRRAGIKAKIKAALAK